MPDVAAAVVQLLDFRPVDVEAEHPEAGGPEPAHHRQADVAEPDDPERVVAALDAALQVVDADHR